MSVRDYFNQILADFNRCPLLLQVACDCSRKKRLRELWKSFSGACEKEIIDIAGKKKAQFAAIFIQLVPKIKIISSILLGTSVMRVVDCISENQLNFFFEANSVAGYSTKSCISFDTMLYFFCQSLLQKWKKTETSSSLTSAHGQDKNRLT